MGTPKSTRGTITIKPTGNTLIDALLSEAKWSIGSSGALELSFSFGYTDGDSFYYGPNGSASYSSHNEQNFSPKALTADQQKAAINALTSWANVANIKFTETADNASSAGDIRFAWTSVKLRTDGSSEPWGWAYLPGNYPGDGDVWLSLNGTTYSSTKWNPGSYNYMSLLHEIGHALGLKHSFEDGAKLDSNFESTRFTIMSYTQYKNDLFRTITYDASNKPVFNYTYVDPSTPMVLDIAAMQYMYGANMDYQKGDNTYTFDPKSPFMKTIWDAGGQDTISVSNFSLGCTIDLNPGSYSSIHMISDPLPAGYTGGTTPTYDGTKNLGIAYNAWIENAIGGAGDDILLGNDLKNTLTGNGGNDSIDGGAGFDLTYLNGKRSQFQVSTSNGVTTIKDTLGKEGQDTIINVERILFNDAGIAFDINGIAGDAYRLYKAAFNRQPDLAGLGYWIKQMDNGMKIDEVAMNFLLSNEYKTLNGENPTNYQLVENLYKFVLHRTPDQAGFDYWINEINNNIITPARMLASFAASAENQAQVLGNIQTGIEYIFYNG